MTRPTDLPRGAGLDVVPELLIREVLIYGFRELAGDAPRLEELLGRVDALYGGTQDEWAGDLRAALLRMLDPTERGVIGVGVGYPGEETPLPYVSIVTEAGGENTGEATAGDLLGKSIEVVGTVSASETTFRSIEHNVMGVGWNTTVQIGTWTRVAEESTLLAAVVAQIMFKDKGRLLAGGVHEVGFSEGGFAPDENMAPLTGYVPVLRCTLSWTRRVTQRSDPVPTRINLRRAQVYR